MTIKKNLSTQRSREFWESFPESSDDDTELPSIGDPWWEAENELSPALLDSRSFGLELKEGIKQVEKMKDGVKDLTLIAFINLMNAYGFDSKEVKEAIKQCEDKELREMFKTTVNVTRLTHRRKIDTLIGKLGDSVIRMAFQRIRRFASWVRSW